MGSKVGRLPIARCFDNAATGESADAVGIALRAGAAVIDGGRLCPLGSVDSEPPQTLTGLGAFTPRECRLPTGDG